MGIECISWTQGQQGGIGYPPELVKYNGKWFWVEKSRSHGGSICFQCSRDRGIPYGYRPGGFAEQPKPYGSRCYRSLRPRTKSHPRNVAKAGIMTWREFVNIIKREYGEPEVVN